MIYISYLEASKKATIKYQKKAYDRLELKVKYGTLGIFKLLTDILIEYHLISANISGFIKLKKRITTGFTSDYAVF